MDRELLTVPYPSAMLRKTPPGGHAMKHSTRLRVQGATLLAAYQDAKFSGPAIPVDSPDWFTWLGSRQSFTYRDPAYGTCTVRCEPSKDKRHWYWHAYCRAAGK